MSICRMFWTNLNIIIIIYNKMTSRSSSFPYKWIEVFVNLLDIYQFYSQNKVMYELELHMSWNMLGGIEISKFDL
jgi:hypothetical protein